MADRPVANSFLPRIPQPQLAQQSAQRGLGVRIVAPVLGELERRIEHLHHVRAVAPPPLRSKDTDQLVCSSTKTPRRYPLRACVQQQPPDVAQLSCIADLAQRPTAAPRPRWLPCGRRRWQVCGRLPGTEVLAGGTQNSVVAPVRADLAA